MTVGMAVPKSCGRSIQAIPADNPMVKIFIYFFESERGVGIYKPVIFCLILGSSQDYLQVLNWAEFTGYNGGRFYAVCMSL